MDGKNNKNLIKERLITLGVGTIAIILVLGSISLVNFYLNKKFPEEEKPPIVVVKEPEIKPSEFPDYEAYKSFDKKIILVKGNPSFVTKDYKKIGEVEKQFSVKGKFRRAYMFVNASVDNGRPLTVYDSIYILLNYKGGHILRNKSLPTPSSDTTQLLYDMREIPYITNIPYSENKQALFTNWLEEMNSKESISFYTFLSSWRPGGLIKEITIAFECEENSECNIVPK